MVLINKLYWLYADGIKYRFHVESCTRNDLEPEEEGVKGILLIREDNEDDLKFGFREIYVPDSFLEENYPDKYEKYRGEVDK